MSGRELDAWADDILGCTERPAPGAPSVYSERQLRERCHRASHPGRGIERVGYGRDGKVHRYELG